MNIVINVDEFINDSKNSLRLGGETTYTLQQKFVNDIKRISEEKGATKLIVNGNIASIIQDIKGYKITRENLLKKVKPGDVYAHMGELAGLQIIVEIQRKWLEHRMTFTNDKDEVVYEGVILDSYGVLV